MYYLYSSILCLFTFMFIKFEGHYFIKNQIQIKYAKWNSLNSLISTKHKNIIVVIYYSFKLLAQALYLSFRQSFNNHIIKIDKNNYILTYIINGKMYKNYIKVKRGPSPIIQISNESSEDITSEILEYLGPNYDWNKSKITPKLLGHKKIIFECTDSEEKIYIEEDILPNF